MPNTPPRLMASAPIRTSRFVKISGPHKGAESDANESTVGICYAGSDYAPLSDLVSTNDHAKANDPIGLLGEGEGGLLTAGAAVTAGDYLKSDADGKGVTILASGTTVQKVGALALETAAADGDIILAQVVRFDHRPALS